MATALKWNGATALAAIRREAAWRLNAAGVKVVQRAQQLCPVDTGFLRSSIAHTFDASTLTLIIYADAPYAVWVEMGSSRNPAQPFLRPAISEMSRYLSAVQTTTLRFSTVGEKYAPALRQAHGGTAQFGRVRAR